MLSYMAVAGLAALIAAAQRVALLMIYRRWFHQGMAGDAAFHLAVVRELKRGGRYTGIPHFLIKDEPDSYPILFHRIAAILPLRAIERWPYLPNFMLWVVLSTCAAAYAHYVGSTLLRAPGLSVALVFATVFCGLASNLSSDMNGLNYISLSERLLSRFACGFYFCALANWMTFGDTPSLVIASFAGAVVAVSSMFGRQAVAFVTPLVALITLDLRPVFVLAVSFAVALLIDGRYLLRGIRHMAQFSYAYNHHTKHSRYYKSGLSRFVDWRLLLRRGVGFSPRVTELELYEPTRVVFRYPELVLILALWIGEGVEFIEPVVAVVLSTIVVYLATSSSYLRHFGEANRYIEYNLWILLALALAERVANGTVPTAWLLAYGTWIALITFKKYKAWSALRFPDSDRLQAFLTPLSLERDSTVFTVPFSLGAAVCSRVQCRALMYQGSAVTLALYQKFMEEIPFLKREWRALASEFEVTHIVAEKAYLAAMNRLVGWEYDFTGAKKVAETESYVAYAVIDPAALPADKVA